MRNGIVSTEIVVRTHEIVNGINYRTDRCKPFGSPREIQCCNTAPWEEPTTVGLSATAAVELAATYNVFKVTWS